MSQKKRPRRKLNVRFVIQLMYVAVAGVVLSGGIHVLHGYQVGRNADVLLRQANEAEARGQVPQAIGLLYRYLTLRPDALEGVVRLGDCLSRTATSSRGVLQSLMAYEVVLRQQPDRTEIRRKAIDAAIRIERFSDAAVHIQQLLETDPADATLVHRLAQCEAGSGRYRKAAELYLQANDLDEKQIDIYIELVGLLELHADELPLQEIDPLHEEDVAVPAVIERVLSEMVEKGLPQFEAFLARADYYRKRGELEQAAEDIQQALEIAGFDVEVLLGAAELAIRRAEWAQLSAEPGEVEQHFNNAIEYCQRGLKQTKPDLNFYLLQADIQRLRNDADASLAVIQEGLSAIEARRAEGDVDSFAMLKEVERKLLFGKADLLINRSIRPDNSVDESRLNAAKEIISQLRNLQIKPALISFLEAQVLLVQRQPQLAAVMLERTRPELESFADLTKRTEMMLSTAYAQLGNPDAQLDVFRRALDAFPLWPTAHLGYAEALLAVGRVDEAVRQYRGLVSVPQVPLILAKVSMLQQVELPASARNWSLTRSVLDLAEEKTPGDPNIAVLRAQVLSYEGKYDEADLLLQDTLRRAPDSVGVWAGVARARLNRADALNLSNESTPESTQAVADLLAAVDEILKKAVEKLGSRTELDIIRIEWASRLPFQEASQVLSQMEETLSESDTERELSLRQALSRAYEQIGDTISARRITRSLVELQPDSIPLRLVVSRLDLTTGDYESAKAHLAAVRQLEGPDGPNGNYLEASLLLDEMRRTGDVKPYVSRARELLLRAEQQRPNWSPVPHARGLVEDLVGNYGEAFDRYRRAIALGDRSREVVSRVVNYLFEKRQFDEADTLLQKLADEDPLILSGDLARLSWQIAWEREQYDRALGVAGEIAEDTDDYRDLIWLSRLRSSRGQEGATIEEPLRRAVALAPDVSETWIALVSYLSRNERVQEAEVVIREAESKLPPALADVTLGQCYELIGGSERAGVYYKKGVDARPKDVTRRIIYADYLSRTGQLNEMNQQLDVLVDPEFDAPSFAVAWARRRQAVRIASGGLYNDTVEALKLLQDDISKRREETPEDLRVEAKILLNSPNASNRKTAIQKLEKLARSVPLSGEERLTLIELYDASGDWLKSREHILELLAANPQNVYLTAYYVEQLIRREHVGEAEVWLEKLESFVPKSMLTVRLRAELTAKTVSPELAAQILVDYVKSYRINSPAQGLADVVKQGRIDDAVKMLESFLKQQKDAAAELALEQAREHLKEGRPKEAAARVAAYIDTTEFVRSLNAEGVRLAAQVCESIRQYDAAEALFREYVDRAATSDSPLELAAYYGRRGRVEDALQICEQSWGRASPSAIANTSLGIVGGARSDTQVLKRVEVSLRRAIQESPHTTWPRLAMASLMEMLNRPQESEAMYRVVLSMEPANPWALNNLAYLLAIQRRDLGEAMQLIQKPLAMIGPIPSFLDTRALVYLAAKKPEAAIADLERALETSKDPVIYFHLAQAYLQSHREKDAREALARAREAGFEEASLYQLERRSYDRLVVDLK